MWFNQFYSFTLFQNRKIPASSLLFQCLHGYQAKNVLNFTLASLFRYQILYNFRDFCQHSSRILRRFRQNKGPRPFRSLGTLKDRKTLIRQFTIHPFHATAHKALRELAKVTPILSNSFGLGGQTWRGRSQPSAPPNGAERFAAHWTESTGGIGRNVEILKAYIFEHMRQRSFRVVSLVYPSNFLSEIPFKIEFGTK